jgi:hypothetical protein
MKKTDILNYFGSLAAAAAACSTSAQNMNNAVKGDQISEIMQYKLTTITKGALRLDPELEARDKAQIANFNRKIKQKIKKRYDKTLASILAISKNIDLH